MKFKKSMSVEGFMQCLEKIVVDIVKFEINDEFRAQTPTITDPYTMECIA